MKINLGELRRIIRESMPNDGDDSNVATTTRATQRDLALRALGGDNDSFLVLQDLIEEEAGEEMSGADTSSTLRSPYFDDRLAIVFELLDADIHRTSYGGFSVKNVGVGDVKAVSYQPGNKVQTLQIKFTDGSYASLDPTDSEGQALVASPQVSEGWIQNAGRDPAFVDDIDTSEIEPEIQLRAEKRRLILFISLNGDPNTVSKIEGLSAYGDRERSNDPELVDLMTRVASEYKRIVTAAINFYENAKRGIGGSE